MLRLNSTKDIMVVSPFYLYTFLRVLLGMGLMNDAYRSGHIFQVQRSLHYVVSRTTLYCRDGVQPLLKYKPDTYDTSYPNLFTDVPTPTFPNLPDIPLPNDPNPTYEWIVVQLRWICATLLYSTVIVSIITKRLTNVLNETNGPEISSAFENSLKYMRCIESMIVYFSFWVYVVEKAYALEEQQALSMFSSHKDDFQHTFTAEMFMVIIVSVIGMIGTILQFYRCQWAQAGVEFKSSGSSLI